MIWMEAQLAKVEGEKSAMDRTSGQVVYAQALRSLFLSEITKQAPVPVSHETNASCSSLGCNCTGSVALSETSGRAEPLSFRMSTPPNLSMSSSS